MNFPDQLKYTKSHEWIKLEGDLVTVGITDHAQRALGDIVFIELPTAGKTLKQGETFGVVESIKAVSDLYSPISGVVKKINSALVDDPSLVNLSPYEKAWMIQVQVNGDVGGTLMSAKDYSAYVDTLK